MKIDTIKTQAVILTKEQLPNIKGGTETVTTSTENIVTGDTLVF